jgi:indole-3-glycerol phosphate synthase
MNFLQAILEHKRAEVKAQKHRVPLGALQAADLYRRRPVSLVESLSGKPMAVIAELKKASPSKNVIRQDFEPIAIALEFVRAGASALSILTDRRFFQGDLSTITSVRPHVAVPLLRKDFIIDEYQIHEAKAAGADAVLLIVAALERRRLIELKECAEGLGLEALIEVHSGEELRLIRSESIRLIGINNRDLSTFETDLSTTLRVRTAVPQQAVIVSESGISTVEELRQLARNDIHAVLIGEALMRAPSPGDALRKLLSSVTEQSWSK